jgi:hypothetical protein
LINRVPVDLAIVRTARELQHAAAAVLLSVVLVSELNTRNLWRHILQLLFAVPVNGLYARGFSEAGSIAAESRKTVADDSKLLPTAIARVVGRRVEEDEHLANMQGLSNFFGPSAARLNRQRVTKSDTVGLRLAHFASDCFS